MTTFTFCKMTFLSPLRTKVLFVFSLVSLNIFLQAQMAPIIEWRKTTHSPGGLDGKLQTAEQSGEEWWFSHKNAYDASGTHTAYVSVGYTSLVSTSLTFSKAQDMYNEGSDSPYNPITPEAYNYTQLPEGCHDRDYVGIHRTPARGNMGMNTLDGGMVYCKPKTIGALEEVIQDPENADYFYVVGCHLGVKPYRVKDRFIRYNPTAAHPSDYFSISALGVSPGYTNEVSHLYVAKVNVDGSVVWEAMYGIPEYAVSAVNAYLCMSYGYSIIKNSAGNLVVTGLSSISTSTDAASFPCVMEIDPAGGALLKKTLLPLNGTGISPVTNTVNGTCISGAGKSIVEIGTSGKYVLATTYFFGNTQSNEVNNAAIWYLDKDLNPAYGWPKNPLQIGGAGPDYFNSNIWHLYYHQRLKQVLVPVVRDCIKCMFAGQNEGIGYIYRLNSDGTFATDGINPSSMGKINAFDLRIGVSETSDGGFIAVSSTRPPDTDHTPATQDELGYMASCNEDIDFPNWDSDALVAKYFPSGKLQWLKIFDVEDDRKRMPPPGDLKRQECMYRVTEAQQGGYVISGNASYNFDDNYMAKIADDCYTQQTFTFGPEYVINITGNVVWDKSCNVLGKIIIHPGAMLSVSGPSTQIHFADSKLTGIETNISILDGGILNLVDGAQLSPMDPSVCKNSKWDGVVNAGKLIDGDGVLLYPNPSSSEVRIVYNGMEVDEVNYTVIDAYGKLVGSGQMNTDYSGSFNTQALAEGIYFITLSKGNKIFEKQKLLVVHP